MGFLMNPIYTKEGPVPTTLISFGRTLATHAYYYIVNAILYSILAPLDYKPFLTSTEAHEIFWSIELKHLCNNFVAAGKTVL
jgi:hypothetical protein